MPEREGLNMTMNYGPAEMMCVALAREIREGDMVFHGLASPVPMTAMKLAKALGGNSHT